MKEAGPSAVFVSTQGSTFVCQVAATVGGETGRDGVESVRSTPVTKTPLTETARRNRMTVARLLEALVHVQDEIGRLRRRGPVSPHRRSWGLPRPRGARGRHDDPARRIRNEKFGRLDPTAIQGQLAVAGMTRFDRIEKHR